MIVHLLIMVLCVFPFICYVFCYSPPAKRIGDELFYDPLEESLRRHGGCAE